MNAGNWKLFALIISGAVVAWEILYFISWTVHRLLFRFRIRRLNRSRNVIDRI